jgi:hypothetical protein
MIAALAYSRAKKQAPTDPLALEAVPSLSM